MDQLVDIEVELEAGDDDDDDDDDSEDDRGSGSEHGSGSDEDMSEGQQHDEVSGLWCAWRVVQGRPTVCMRSRLLRAGQRKLWCYRDGQLGVSMCSCA
jgi:hypothetical protein